MGHPLSTLIRRAHALYLMTNQTESYSSAFYAEGLKKGDSHCWFSGEKCWLSEILSLIAGKDTREQVMIARCHAIFGLDNNEDLIMSTQRSRTKC